MSVFTPIIHWSQTNEIVHVKIETPSPTDETLSVNGSSFKYECTSEGKKFALDLTLYASVSSHTRSAAKNAVELALHKESAEWWPRLVATEAKLWNVKVDFSRFAEEDSEGEQAPLDFSSIGMGEE